MHVFNLPVQVEKSRLEEMCSRRDEVLKAKEHDIEAKERALTDEIQSVRSLTGECTTLRSEMEHLTVSHGSGTGYSYTVKTRWLF